MSRLQVFALELALISPAVAGPPAPPPAETDALHITVTEERPAPVDGVRISERAATAVHLGDRLEAVPGVSLVRRGADASDPVIRGLSGDRVQTRVGVVPLHGACPSRMDPPVTYLGATSARDAVVEMGAPSVHRGGAATGGRISVPVALRRADDAPDRPTGWIEGRWDSTRAGGGLDAAVEGRLGTLDYRLAGGLSRLDDYETPDGVTVPAGRDEWTATASLRWKATSAQDLWATATYAAESGVDTPALPMDIDTSNTALINAGYVWRRPGLALEQVTVEAGLGLVDHVMSNANKPNRGLMEARTPSSADSYAAAARVRWRLPVGTLTTGVDAQRVARDATRSRYMVAADQTIQDHIWPEVSQQEAGLFADLRVPLPESMTLEVGLRAGGVQSDARAVDEPGMGGKSIRAHYAAFYGEDAADVGQTEPVGGGRLALSWAPAEWFTAALSSGVTTAAADVNSRYFAFAPAPGGFQIGNPTLDAERRWTLDLSGTSSSRYLDLRAGVFLHQIEDFVLRTVRARRDVNGDGTVDRIFGFENTEARLVGGEVAATVKPVAHLTLPVSAAWVRGENTAAGKDLPQIPPLEIEAAARVTFDGHWGWWAEGGVRHVTEQTAIDADFGEDETPAFTVLHLHAGLSLWAYGRVEAGVDNLLDETYHEHLTREALLPVGGLKAGDEISAPGRRLFVRLRGSF